MAWQIDAILDLVLPLEATAPHRASGGRPSINPELLLRTLPAGCLYGVRSERQRWCEEVDLNPPRRRFRRPGLDGCVPDHSACTENRHGRFSSEWSDRGQEHQRRGRPHPDRADDNAR
ncbi:transposase [Hasllibacter halocynthiae]|uniref:transposase n=1 Tax=Hasllibacter halocynthiae TaxID=595589 RepID=UPI0011B220C1